MDAEPLLCVVCSTPDRPRPVDDPYGLGVTVCARDQAAIREALEDVGDWWPDIATPDALLPVVGSGGRRSPGFRSTPPLRLDIVDITNPRLPAATEPGDLRYPPDVLCGWAVKVAEARDDRNYQDSVLWAVGYLLENLTWVFRQEWAGELWAEVRDVHRQVGQVMPDSPKRVLVGRCPNLVDTGGADRERCNTRLYLPSTGSTIPCGGCGRRYERPEWRQLGEDMQEAG